MDKLTKERRRWNMSRVRSADTKPERIVRSLLHRQGFRFRLHVKELPGHPDIVLPKFRTVIFVHGCFWHQHGGCSKSKLPDTNTAFWRYKLGDNAQRDRRNVSALEAAGWRVFVIWECELGDLDSLTIRLAPRLVNAKMEQR